MNARRISCGIHNNFSAVGGGLRRGCIITRSRDGMLKFFGACVHAGCYANVGFGVGRGGMLRFLARAHMAELGQSGLAKLKVGKSNWPKIAE